MVVDLFLGFITWLHGGQYNSPFFCTSCVSITCSILFPMKCSNGQIPKGPYFYKRAVLLSKLGSDLLLQAKGASGIYIYICVCVCITCFILTSMLANAGANRISRSHHPTGAKTISSAFRSISPQNPRNHRRPCLNTQSMSTVRSKSGCQRWSACTRCCCKSMDSRSGHGTDRCWGLVAAQHSTGALG